MAQKIVEIPGIGQVTLSKRRGAKNLRLSILPNGKVRVSLPLWAPYSTAISFALSRADWIKKNTFSTLPLTLADGNRIGKSYRLRFISNPKAVSTQARLGINSITVTSYLDFNHIEVQGRAQKAAEKALKKEAEILLGVKLAHMAQKHNLVYKKTQIKKLSSRWGSCSSSGVITLNYFLVQLPWRLIDYVIAHELAHTVHLNHSLEFWQRVEEIIPDAKARRREIKKYRPVLLPDR